MMYKPEAVTESSLQAHVKSVDKKRKKSSEDEDTHGSEEAEGDEGSDADSDDDKPASKRSKTVPAKKVTPSKKKAAKGTPKTHVLPTTKENGFTKKKKISDELAAFLGVPQESRTQVRHRHYLKYQ
jgi:chromatin remodeling complex protein RSC6